MKIKGHQRQMLSAKESFYVGESVMNAFEQDDEHEMKVYTAGEHKRGDDGHYYGYATIAHPRMGEFVVSFNTSDGRPMTNGYPWEFLEKDQLTHEQAAWVMGHQEQLADKLKEGEPEFDFVEYAKMQPRLFNPRHVAFNKGEIFRLHENVYYGEHDVIGQMLDIEEDYDQPLTEDGKRRIEEAAVKHGLKFDRAEDMFYFPKGTLAEVVDVNGPSGWPVLRINEVEYDFAGDPFKVSFGGSNGATENVKPRKVAKESFYVGESVMNAFEQDDEHEMKVYTAGEHKRGDDGHYYGYATIAHPRMGEFVVSFNTSDGRPMTNGYPWEFLEKDQLTHEQAAWVMGHQEQLADKLKEGEPEFDFVEYAKMQPRLFNPRHVAFNKGEIFRLHENVYYGEHDVIGQMLDIEEDYDQPLTEDGKRRIEEAAVKHGLKFDRAEDMFYFPKGTLAEVVDVNGPSGWPVLRINEVEYDFAGDPFKVSFGGSNGATENVKPRKVAKETFNRKARKFSKEAYEELIASMEAEGDEFTIPEEYIMNPTEVNFKKILQERDRKREEEAKAKAEPILLEEATNHFTTVGGMRPGMRIHLPEYGQVWMTVKDVKSVDPWRVALTLDTNGSTQTLTVGKNSLWYLDPASDTKGATESATAAGSQAKSKSF